MYPGNINLRLGNKAEKLKLLFVKGSLYKRHTKNENKK